MYMPILWHDTSDRADIWEFIVYFQPLYGLIQAKLELITHAYFEERDFSQVTLLEETYRNLNAGLKASLLEGSQVFLGGCDCLFISILFISKCLYDNDRRAT